MLDDLRETLVPNYKNMDAIVQSEIDEILEKMITTRSKKQYQ